MRYTGRMNEPIIIPESLRDAFPVTVYDTAKKTQERIQPVKKNIVSMYACGPTVYGPAHVGNWRSYIFEDTLKRILELWGYDVKHVMNITDVGHLTSDGDTGEDKLQKAAREKRKTAWDIARMYADRFKKDMKTLRLKEPDVWAPATEYINAQIEMIKTLEKKKHLYNTSDGVYFDITTFPRYTEFAQLNLEHTQTTERMKDISEKRNPHDFAVWKFSPQNEKRDMEWDSPWGVGFPGWHMECSAIIKETLGNTIDIHCGGIDHVTVHHTNEIAQSECANGKPLAQHWMHNEHILVDNEKMSKSLKNTYTISDIRKKGIDPLAYKFWVLQSHYRQKINFTWDAITAAETGFDNLKKSIHTARTSVDKSKLIERFWTETEHTEYRDQFLSDLSKDIGTPGAIATLFAVLKNNAVSNEIKHAFALVAESIFDLNLFAYTSNSVTDIPEDIQTLLDEREFAKKHKRYERADEIRDMIDAKGYSVIDTSEGSELVKK